MARRRTWWTFLAVTWLLPLAALAQEREPEAQPEKEEEQAQEPAQEPAPVEPAEAEAPRKIQRIQFKGNRRVEDDAIRAALVSREGAKLDPEKIRADVRAIWQMGFFDEVRVEAEATDEGLVLTFVVAEKPAIRKIFVSGNDELGLDKINEVLDLKRESILDLTRVKKNVEKVHDLYVSKGYYLASVDYQVRPVSESEVDVWFMVDERSKVQVRRVTFLGNKEVSEAELRSVMGTQEGSAFSFLTDSGTYQEDVFERDLALITAFYYDRGHVNVKIGTPQITLSKDKRYMYITIPIDEGPVFSIGKLDFQGELLAAKGEFMKLLTVKSGDTFNRTRLGQDIQKLNDYYKDRGYAYVNITPLTSVSLERRSIDISFEVERGQKVYFERINIRGNSKTRDKVIRRELKISEGELFNQTNLETSRRRVNALGFFEKVDVSTRRGSSDEYIEVTIEVAERATGTFQIGAGFSSVENFIAQAQISQNNLFGRGQTLALQAQLSGVRQLFLLRFVEPYFLDTSWTFAFDLFNQARAFEGFQRDSTGGDLTWGYPLSYESRFFVTYKLENVDVTPDRQRSGPLDQGPIANLYRGGFTSSLRASISYDSRDNRLFPTKGWYHNLFVEVADKVTASENVFVRYGGFSRYYRPIYGPFVLKLNGEVGVVTSRLPEGVPISERYLVGGINDIRGFRPRSLGPRISASGRPDDRLVDQTLGGNLQLIMNTEIEFPLFQRVGISGVVFFDAGNAFNLEPKWCQGRNVSAKIDPCFDFPDSIIHGVRSSVGFGFRWFSPIGPLRFEWGIPLDRQPGENPLVFEFTIGNFF
ncbi:MAG: outer membrane protein assembly factor BamA [Deltaproteobacteria bacterium]|nr:outer membrane protein assembly factor BamA [Deltaproteobacteria bacterium]